MWSSDCLYGCNCFNFNTLRIMTQEDKELLIKDLCARLPYETLVFIRKPFGCVVIEEEVELTADILQDFIENDDIRVRPFLRPLSSMTEEEFEKLKEYSGLIYEQLDLASFQNGTYKCLDFYLSEVPSDVVILVFDWLNAHHFDYRCLMQKRLALEASEGMYRL